MNINSEIKNPTQISNTQVPVTVQAAVPTAETKTVDVKKTDVDIEKKDVEINKTAEPAEHAAKGKAGKVKADKTEKASKKVAAGKSEGASKRVGAGRSEVASKKAGDAEFTFPAFKDVFGN